MVLRHYRLAMAQSSRSMGAGPESKNHLRVKQGSQPALLRALKPPPSSSAVWQMEGSRRGQIRMAEEKRVKNPTAAHRD